MINKGYEVLDLPKANYQESHQYQTDQPVYPENHQYQTDYQPIYQENHQKFNHKENHQSGYQGNQPKIDHQPIYHNPPPLNYQEIHPKIDHQPIYQENHSPYHQENHHKFDQPSPYPYKTAFQGDPFQAHGPAHQEPWRSGRKLAIPAIKDNNFPGIVRHISTYGRSLSVSEDLVDFGAATGGHGSFGWYSDHPVGTSAINEGLFA